MRRPIFIHSSRANFKPTYTDEIKTFIALHILMSCLKLTRIRMYREANFNMSVFRDNLSRIRFFLLKSILRIVNYDFVIIQGSTTEFDYFFYINLVSELHLLHYIAAGKPRKSFLYTDINFTTYNLLKFLKCNKINDASG